MNPYRHVAITTREYHEGLMGWSRRLLSEAGLENLEVYGQMPARGLTSSHLVFFPYRLGPEPKVQDNAPGSTLLRPRVPLQPGHPHVPDVWQDLGAALADALEGVFGDLPSPERRGMGRDRGPTYPPVSSLPEPLQAWYGRSEAAQGEPWTIPSQDGPLARPPALGWRQGLAAVVRYIVLAHEPGRGADERTSASPPVALSALNVILSAVHRERDVSVLVPPMPLPDQLLGYARALAEAAPGPVGARIEAALAELAEPMSQLISVVLIQDLNNRELIALMQALQRPLQTSLNLQVRYNLGATATFGPSSWVAFQPKNPGPRGLTREPT